MSRSGIRARRERKRVLQDDSRAIGAGGQVAHRLRARRGRCRIAAIIDPRRERAAALVERSRCISDGSCRAVETVPSGVDMIGQCVNDRNARRDGCQATSSAAADTLWVMSLCHKTNAAGSACDPPRLPLHHGPGHADGQSDALMSFFGRG